MTITRERLTLAFPDDDISTVPLADLPAGITDPATRGILTEVGLPEHVVACFFFKNLEDSMLTLRIYRESEPTPDEVADDYVIGISDYHTTCLDGASGECIFVGDEAGEIYLAATTLSNFLEFMCHLNVEISHVDDEAEEDELDRVEDRLVSHFGQLDPAALEKSEQAWRKLVQRCIGSVLM